MSQLSDDQINLVKTLVAEELTLGDIQKRLAEEGVVITYMDLRFLIDDLDLTLAEPKKPEPKKEEPLTEESAAEEYDQMQMGKLSVEMDAVVRPGALASGSVLFTDGVKASWMLDQMGRLGLTEAPDGYQPSQTDLAEFQTQLRKLIESRSF